MLVCELQDQRPQPCAVGTTSPRRGCTWSIVEPMRKQEGRFRALQGAISGLGFWPGLLQAVTLYLFLAWFQGLEVPKECHSQGGGRQSMVHIAQRRVLAASRPVSWTGNYKARFAASLSPASASSGDGLCADGPVQVSAAIPRSSPKS